MNDAFTAGTGYRAEEAIGRNPTLLRGPRTQRSEQLRYSRVSLLDGCRCLVALAPTHDGRLVIWQIGVVPHLCDHAA